MYCAAPRIVSFSPTATADKFGYEAQVRAAHLHPGGSTMKRSLTRFGWCLALATLTAAPALAEDWLRAPLPDEIAETAAEEPLFSDSLVEPVAYDAAQPAAGMEGMGGMGGMAAAAPATRSPTTRRVGPTGSRQANIRLASVPNMFGDIGMSSGQILVPRTPDPNGLGGSNGSFSIPGAGGSRRVKIGENNVSLPTDRVYVMYNHFHNVFQITEQSGFGPPIQSQAHVDKYTFGFEKTFFDELWSVELRQAFNSSFDYNGAGFGVDGGNVGNMAIILKNLLYIDDNTAVAGGVAFDLPTGNDVDVNVNGLLLDFQNDALHILPWVGFANNMDPFYVTGFAQLDIAANGNEIQATQFGNRTIGTYNEQNLLYLDMAVGRFLYQNPYAERLTSIALQGELHYTTTIQDTDVVSATINGQPFAYANAFNRQDIVNGTVALQFQLGLLSTFRVAAVAPLSEAIDERVFDAEVQAQYNRRF